MIMDKLTYPLTPFIEKVLTLVRDTCDPRAVGWAGLLHEKLYREFYRLRQPGDLLTADDANVEAFKLQALEEKVMPTQAPQLRSATEVINNHYSAR
jgi:hypothetical protein